MTSNTLRLPLLTLVVLVAFAGNSLLNRLAVAGSDEALADPLSFAMVRVIGGAVTLIALGLWQGKIRKLGKPNWASVVGLSTYLLGFSVAYVHVDAGLGALVLFAVVQATMFGWAVCQQQSIGLRRWLGMIVALVGLIVLLLPTSNADSQGPALWSLLLMAGAGVGWGLYSLVGANSADPLADTAWNFVYAIPFVTLVWGAVFATAVNSTWLTPTGAALALVAGAVTSGLGYALWYAVLPALGATKAAMSQLSVPVIAALGGMLLLGESISVAFIVSSVLVLGGIGLGLGARGR